MIKDLFNKDLFVSSGCDKKAKTQSLIVTLVVAFLYACCAFCMFNFIYLICNVVGSIVSGSPECAVRDFIRSSPILLILIATFNLLVSAHNFRRNVSTEIRNKMLMRNSISAIVIAGLTIVLILIFFILGKYDSLIDGYPSYLYPLDAIIFSLLIIGFATISILYVKKFEEKHPYVGVNRAPSTKGKLRALRPIFETIWALAALYGLAAFIFSPVYIDWIHGHVFFSIMLVIMFVLPTVYYLWWEFYYNELKAENHKINLIPSIVGLCIGVLTVGLYCLAYNLDPQAPNLADFALLAVDYTASVNATALIYSACNIIIPLVALIKCLIEIKRNK